MKKKGFLSRWSQNRKKSDKDSFDGVLECFFIKNLPDTSSCYRIRLSWRSGSFPRRLIWCIFWATVGLCRYWSSLRLWEWSLNWRWTWFARLERGGARIERRWFRMTGLLVSVAANVTGVVRQFIEGVAITGVYICRSGNYWLDVYDRLLLIHYVVPTENADGTDR